jgi:processive 1,2-diacylglycerol beta-glucosyltransferase
MRPRAHIEVLKTASAKHDYLVDKLELAPDRFTVFLATGGNGANNHLELLPKLLPYGRRVQAIIICGKNREAYNEVIHWRNEHPEFDIFVDGFSEDVHLLLQVSDAIVTRGGTTTCAKALHFKCPIIFNAIGGVMPQEELTVKFFRNARAAELVRNAEDFAAVLDRWMEKPQAYQDLRERFLDLRYDEDPTTVVEELVDLGAAAAGTKLKPRPFPPPQRKGGSSPGWAEL